jgi:hypothetical protein
MEEKENAILNRVTNSGLITIDLEDYYQEGERVLLDIAPVLFQGLILREKDFRQWVKEQDWEQYSEKFVAVYCSVDAIVPTWAYMLLSTKLQPFAKMVAYGTLDTLEEVLFRNVLEQIKPEDYEGAKLVIKGCSNKPVPTAAYVEVCRKLAAVASSIMYGEPCSTVPVYKRPKK